MKIKYCISGKYHGYDEKGFPIYTDEENAAVFPSEESALLQIAHDYDQFNFGGENVWVE